MKYKKLNNGINLDFEIYLAQEGLYHYLLGHKLTKKQRNKVNYIWNALLKQYPERAELEKEYIKDQANLIEYPD